MCFYIPRLLKRNPEKSILSADYCKLSPTLQQKLCRQDEKFLVVIGYLYYTPGPQNLVFFPKTYAISPKVYLMIKTQLHNNFGA